MFIFQVTGCRIKEVPNDDKEIYIAVMGSKEVYDYDSSFLNGIELAIKDCNQQYASKGYKAAYEVYDDKYDFEKGVLLSKKLVTDPRVTAVIGSHSFNILDSSSNFFEDSKKILVAANGMMDKSLINKKHKFIFRNTFGEAEMGSSMADHAAQTGADRIAIYHSNTEFENSLCRAFSKRSMENGLKILDDVSDIGSQKEFDNMYNRWKNIGVNCVLISQEGIDDAFMLAEQIRSKTDDIQIYGDFSFDADEKLLEHKKAVEGIIIPKLVPISYSQRISEFNKRYEEIYKQPPTWWAAHSYDSVRMIIDTAVKINSNQPELIAKELHSEKGYLGITGNIAFDANGILSNRSPLYSIVKDGKLVNLEVSK